ncbi:4-oxalocrotonate decarboxylase [Rhizorhabdus wittichii RW1]|uniref:4-oxalocrotonate decarboxylase n=1 Tax=Rhizorhabdus wittichii (strain DSM 6014 / CCUG 31198 / JCM 15750 / NBRC 105917 / EY 4224 / RW1) TaxID=392499 RepID=A0A9J9HAN5_RHIWR|nr:4-oxalocrotonate decarboxylase [Rhizorhabdus wittichii RW1]
MERQFDHAARLLRDAYRGESIAPLRAFLEPLDIDGAYAVQAINTRYWIDQGRRLVGRKIGATAKAVQRQFGIDQPDFGALFADMRIDDGGVLDPATVTQPRAEAEIAFLLGRDLADPDLSLDDVAAAIDGAMAAIEIVDSRITGWKITLSDTIADNGSSAFFILGTEVRSPIGLDLYSCGMVTEINGEIVSVGAGAACFDHPYKSVRWLARTLALNGEPLRAGDILLSGALGPMVALTPGDEVRTRIGGLGTCTFTYGA